MDFLVVCSKTQPNLWHKKSVAEIIIETLVAAGVKRIYGVVGDSLNGIFGRAQQV